MKHEKLILTICIIIMVLGMGVLGYLGVKTEGFGIFANDKGDMRKDLTSIEMAHFMGNGINLGNTMEAYGHATLGVDADVSAYETGWGMPVTTQEIIDSMKAAGFDSLRIPIAWTNMMDFESGDYTINPAYLDRVEEIINYALNNDMYVVINDHWDGGWWGMFGSATQETRDAAMEMYISMWTQIADRYKDYSDYLIFESANEELGSRLNDIDIAADSGTLSEDECYEMNLKINQSFVDTIRSTGGNNENRFLLIAGYNTDITKTCDERFIMPTDSAKEKLMLSVHYYTPWGYAGSESLSSWGTEKNYAEQNELLAMMTKFTDQGYGIVFGEYAVLLKNDGSMKNNTYEFLENFLNNCDLYGYCPMLWDCNNLFIRTDYGFFDEDIATLFSSRSLATQSNMTEVDKVVAAQEALATALEVAKEIEVEKEVAASDEAMAWIMFNSSDWSVMYSVGDAYDPASKTDGLVATDVAITGAGTYTVSLDFTGTGAGFANSTVFSALAISNGELLFPGYVVTITDLQINGESYSLTGKPYTGSDDGKSTRVNIYNEWVNSIPDEARSADGNISDVSPSIVDATKLGEIKTITLTFDYGPVE